MKKFLAAIIGTVMLVSVLPIVANADSGIYGDLKYVAYDDYVAIKRYVGELTEIEIPSEIDGLPVISIGANAFDDCVNLKRIKLSASISNLGGNAGIASPFNYNVPNLENIDVDPANPYFTSVDGVLFDKNITTLIKYPSGKNQIEYTIPDSVIKLGDCTTFYQVSHLENLTLSENCMSLYGLDHSNPRLSNIKTGQNSLYYTSADGVLFNKDMTKLEFYPSGKTQSEYQIPDNVTTVAGRAFNNCINLRKVTMPKGMTNIGNYVFEDCPKLENIVIPLGIQNIGHTAFRNVNIYYGGTEEQWNDIKLIDLDNKEYIPYWTIWTKDYKKTTFKSTFYYNAIGTTAPKISNINIIPNSGDTGKMAEIQLGTVEYDSTLIACFGNNNIHIDNKMIDLSAGDTSKMVEIPDNADTVKVFIWDSLEGMRPLCEPKTLTIE